MKKILILFLFIPFLASAQFSGPPSDEPDFITASVEAVLETTFPIIFGIETEFQTLRVNLPDGTTSDTVYNDYTPVKPGDTIYISPGYNPETNLEGFYVREVDRRASVAWLFAFFVIIYVAIAGMRGLRSLVALALSVLAVWFILIPTMIAGYDPLIAGIGISALILGLAIFITHGLTIISLSSYVGSLISIVLTVIFATIAVSVARISGVVGDTSGTLAAIYGSAIDLQGLLLAAMIIGILGVLDDVAVMQAAMVREFMYEKKHTLRQIFIKSMRVGQEHAAALVNTLVLAYTAVALPLFLIILAPASSFFGQSTPLAMQLSSELFVTELVRSIVGSFGLVITIPIVTALAILLYKKFPPTEPGSSGHCHGHSHGHHH